MKCRLLVHAFLPLEGATRRLVKKLHLSVHPVRLPATSLLSLASCVHHLPRLGDIRNYLEVVFSWICMLPLLLCKNSRLECLNGLLASASVALRLPCYGSSFALEQSLFPTKGIPCA